MRFLALPLLLAACSPSPTDDTEPAPDPGTPPTAAQGVAIEPAEPVTIQDLQLVVDQEPTDADGDYQGLRVRWTRDGQAISALDDEPTVPAVETGRDQTWEVSVAGVDAAGHVGPESVASVRIGNLPPGTPTVSIRPAEPLAGEDDLICGAEATDPDQDELGYTFSWSSDGGFEVEDAVVLASMVQPGEAWTCTVVASDGQADSAPGTASVTPIAPPIPSFSLVDRNPSSVRHGRDVSPRDYLEKVSGWYFTHAT